MEFKGTQGIWIVEDNGKSVYSESRDKNIAFDGQICRLHTGLNTYDDNTANAKLISCAPEMLEFIKEHYRYLNIDDQNKAKELIKKATTI